MWYGSSLKSPPSWSIRRFGSAGSYWISIRPCSSVCTKCLVSSALTGRL